MLCPIDQTPLVMAERYGIEIDYCPKCRGIWLDRGELDKIIERAQEQAVATRQPQRVQTEVVRESSAPSGYDPYPRHGVPYEERRPTYKNTYKKPKKKKRKSGFGDFLEEIFDF